MSEKGADDLEWKGAGIRRRLLRGRKKIILRSEGVLLKKDRQENFETANKNRKVVIF